MNLSSRFALALLLGTTLATTLSSCDYHWGPGENKQFRHGFTNPPGYHTADIVRDSINNQQKVTTPTGTGSATAIKNGTVQDKINSTPAGASAASPQDASGQMAPADQAQTKK